MRCRKLFLPGALAALAVPALSSQQAGSTLPPPTVEPAVEGILRAFETHPLVGLGDVHGMAQEEDFFVALVRDPRFAQEVGNVVVEFGDAAQQATIDRYVDGEDVPYAQLRKVWADTVGWVPTVTSIGYMNFYAEVRAVNQTLPPAERMHVWLGDPPVDWSKVKTSADVSHAGDRDRYPAELIENQILAKQRKALVIYGVGHFSGAASLKTLVDQAFPQAFFVVTPYFGYTTSSCSDAFERERQGWQVPALASPVHGSVLEDELRVAGCHFVDQSAFTFDKTATDAQKASAVAKTDDKLSGIAGDALLYLGAASKLTYSPISPDLYLDTSFREEISRRFRIVTGQSMTWPTVADNPMSPRYVHTYGAPGWR